MADETRIQVLNEPERNPQTDSFMWVLRSSEYRLPPIVLYHYTKTRAQYNAVAFLDRFSDGYLETDGRCNFSDNLSENAIRPFTVGCKNWLFSATPKGATASALVYTMVEMAKANDLNIYKYLTYLLEHRPSEEMSDDQLEPLTPWSEDVQAACQN